MKWRHLVKSYFSFPKKERLGLLCLIFLMVFIAVLPIITSKPEPLTIQETKMLSAAIDTLQTKEKQYNQDEEYLTSSYQYESSLKTSVGKAEVFFFDPNTLPADGWRRLGLKERTIQTLEKYRTKGGRFYKSEDLQKIWGLSNEFYERVKNYIRIEQSTPTKEEKFITASYSKTEKKLWNIEINSADVVTLEELPGIGNKLAARIINFREKLGGFYSIEQIGETYGLPDSVFQKIKSYLYTSGDVKKLSVNTATKDELKVHPYIKWNLANAIVEYRNQHGGYKKLEELKNIASLDAETYSRMVHYLVL